MDTANFLARVVPPGNYAAVCFKSPGKGLGTRFFPRDRFDEQASFIAWATRKGMDTWFGVASYTTAVLSKPDASGNQRYEGSRSHDNVQALRAFWLDIDVKRAGDNKKSDKVYPTKTAALQWLASFCKSINIMPPNLLVNSGYGLHVYWILEDPMARAAWQPYADAMRDALIANGALLDAAGFVADSARILRPVGGANMKDPANPAPVTVLAQRSDHPNALFLGALKPLLSSKPATGGKGAPNPTVGLAGNVSSIYAGRGPTAATATAPAPSLAQAAQANLPVRRDFLLAEIAKKCEQVKLDLADHGATARRPIWYLGHLSLAHFCADGATMAHELSKGWPTYTPLEVDTALATIAREKTTKGGGAPTCTYYHTTRPGVCSGCKFAGKLNSPLTLGTMDEDGDLPDRYRRHHGVIQKLVPTKDGPMWTDVIVGDVFAPSLTSRYELRFTYERAGRRHEILADNAEIANARGASAYFIRQGVTLSAVSGPLFGEMIVAWIEKLRDLKVDLQDQSTPFGWVRENAAIRGFAVGGTIYRADGTPIESLHAASGVAALYRQSGTIEKWREACDLVTTGRVDMQMIVAASFGAPLMSFTGQPGLLLSVWSSASGVGKSSAFIVGQAVWGSYVGMCSMNDTLNASRVKMGTTRALPCYWDEIKLDKSKARDQLNFIFDVSQGRDKVRLTANSQLMDTGEWSTLVLCSGNEPLLDFINASSENTDAGALRCLEVKLDAPAAPFSPAAAPTIMQCKTNYGHAGRIYAQWLASNAAAAEELVRKISDKVNKDLSPAPGERFIVAGVVSTLAGAYIANRLKLASFDIKPLLEYLYHHVQTLRGERSEMLVNDGKLDLPAVFARFHGWAAGRRVDTQFFKPRGTVPGGSTLMKGDFVVKHPLRAQDPLVIHVGRRDNVMRIDRHLFRLWCTQREVGLSYRLIFDAMTAQWHAKLNRGLLGAGTPYATARVEFIELNLNQPDLEDYAET